MTLLTEINDFHGDWAFLSNFYSVPIALDGERYASVEAAYQAAKTLDLGARKVFTCGFNPNLKPAQAKRMGRALKARGLERPDWQEVSLGVMRELLRQKFAVPLLRQKLLSTAAAKLVEGNWWEDNFYGVCYGGLLDGFNGRRCKLWPHEPNGENHLGKLLMEIRSQNG